MKNLSEISLLHPTMSDVSIRVLDNAVTAAQQQGLSLFMHSSHDLFIRDRISLTGSGMTNFDYDKKSFLAIRAVDESDNVAGTCCWFSYENSTIVPLLQEEALHPHQAIPVMPDVAKYICGKIAFIGGMFISPEKRHFNGLLPILRNTFFAVVYDVHDPDFIIALVRANETKRGSGIHLHYGLPEYSESFLMKGLDPDQDSPVRLVWTNRLGARNFMTRILLEDWTR